jgi:hypothetical protein
MIGDERETYAQLLAPYHAGKLASPMQTYAPRRALSLYSFGEISGRLV